MAVLGKFLAGERRKTRQGLPTATTRVEAQPRAAAMDEKPSKRAEMARKRNIGEPVVGSPQAASGLWLADFHFWSKKSFFFGGGAYAINKRRLFRTNGDLSSLNISLMKVVHNLDAILFLLLSSCVGQELSQMELTYLSN